MSADLDSAQGAPPLAAVLRLAATAWLRFRAGHSLDRALEQAAREIRLDPHPRLAAAAKDVAYTAARHLAALDALMPILAPRTPSPPVAALLAVALGQLRAPRHAPYAVVDQAVAAAKAEHATRAASGFINATLRRFLREQAALLRRVETSASVRANLPAWWLERLQSAYPAQWPAIVAAQREPPPLVLRVNPARVALSDYLPRLQAAGLEGVRVGRQAVWLETPRPVHEIPGFTAGEVSVQDAGAQLAATWLDVRDGQRVLDACAAPGGKTGHLAELAAGKTAVTIDAVERDPTRALRITENLDRLGLHAAARLIVADVCATAARMSAAGQGGRTAVYDRILLDAPCTASGIVRRHPDIPWLRRPGDVAQLATAQQRMLEVLWPLLAPAGRLLYVVCSLFPEEGAQQIERFLAGRADARAVPLAGPNRATLQLLPSLLADASAWNEGDDGAPAKPGESSSPEGEREALVLPALHDGFFYALLEKAGSQ